MRASGCFLRHFTTVISGQRCPTVGVVRGLRRAMDSVTGGRTRWAGWVRKTWCSTVGRKGGTPAPPHWTMVSYFPSLFPANKGQSNIQENIVIVLLPSSTVYVLDALLRLRHLVLLLMKSHIDELSSTKKKA